MVLNYNNFVFFSFYSNNNFLFYLREDQTTGHRSLWRKSLIDESESKIRGLSQFASRLISLNKSDTRWQLSYLAQQNRDCHVSVVELAANNQLINQRKLFDLSTSDEPSLTDASVNSYA